MTEDQTNNPTPDEQPHDFDEMPVETRRASLTLRADDVREQRAASMEAAHKSLADALRITYNLLLVLMVALVLIFVFTGVRQVNEFEVGLKVTFGKITEGNLQPGAHFNLPFPLGEIISVSRSQETMTLDRSFTPVDFNPSRPIEQQGIGTQTLRPGIDGSLLTADGSIAHARLSVSYRIADANLYLEKLNPEQVRDILRALVERATVSTVASVTIDEFLARSSTGVVAAGDPAPSRADSIETRIRSLTQDSVDDLELGLEITEVSLTQVFPPFRVFSDFQDVNNKDAQATQKLEKAEEDRRRALNQAAGSAYRPLLDLIDEYERLDDLGEDDAAEAILQTIFEVFEGAHDGSDVAINDLTYASVVFAGRAAQTIGEARRTAQTIADNARRDAAIFEAKLAQYRANPEAFIAREWREALLAFINSTDRTVQLFFAPSGTALDLILNSDPDVARELQRRRQSRLTEDFLREVGELD